MMKFELAVVYVLVVLYALCYQLQSPIEPFLVEKLMKQHGDAALAYGHLQSFFSLVQTIGSFCIGLLLDRVGVRAGFAINFIACALQYGILSCCDSITMLFASKVPGVAMAGFLCAQAAISRLTTEGTERVEALGRLTTAYTIGGVFGPYIGGYLGASGDYYLGAKLAMAGSMAAVALVIGVLPARIDASINYGERDPNLKPAAPLMRRVGAVLQVCGLLLFCKAATGVANSMGRSSQPLILKNELGFSESDMGTFMSANFMFGGFASGFLLGPLTAFLGGDLKLVIRNSVLAMALLYAAQAAMYSPSSTSFVTTVLPPHAPFIVFNALLAVFQFSLASASTACTTSLVEPSMKGTLLGLEHSLFAIARVFGPATGVALLASFGVSGVASACSACFFGVFIVLALGGAGRAGGEAKKMKAS